MIFNDEFSFDGYTSANPGQLSLFDTNLVVDRQHAIYKIDAKNLVNGKISTIDMYATGVLLSDMYLTIDQIIYVAQV